MLDMHTVWCSLVFSNDIQLEQIYNNICVLLANNVVCSNMGCSDAGVKYAIGGDAAAKLANTHAHLHQPSLDAAATAELV